MLHTKYIKYKTSAQNKKKLLLENAHLVTHYIYRFVHIDSTLCAVEYNNTAYPDSALYNRIRAHDP